MTDKKPAHQNVHRRILTHDWIIAWLLRILAVLLALRIIAFELSSIVNAIVAQLAAFGR